MHLAQNDFIEVLLKRTLGFLTAILVILSTHAYAMPPFNYDSAVKWADESVTTDIPKEKRIYIFGPGKVTETYLLDGKPTQHDIETRHICSSDKVKTIYDAWKMYATYPEGKWRFSVYRKESPSKAIYSEEPVNRRSVFESKYQLQPGDVVLYFPLSQ